MALQKFSDIEFRPTSLAEYEGQEKAKRSLSFYIKAAQMRQEPLDHTIIFGVPGLGKTTLANIIANEMHQEIVTVSGPSIGGADEMRQILMNLGEDKILFIDEIHRLSKKVEEILYFAMEDFEVDVKYGGESVRLPMPRFTLLGATTERGSLSEPLRERFQISIELTPYSEEHIAKIVEATCRKLGVFISESDASRIAQRSRGIPRTANSYVRRIADFAAIMEQPFLNEDVIEEAFDFLGVDSHGLTEQDRRYIKLLYTRFMMRPVGLETLSSSMNDSKSTIENTVEPYLLYKGYVMKTPRGRILTEDGRKIAKEMM